MFLHGRLTGKKPSRLQIKLNKQANKALLTVVPLSYGIGIASAHLVSVSTTTNKYLLPCLVGRSHASISTVTFCKGSPTPSCCIG